MKKDKRSRRDDIQWLDKPPTAIMQREVEDAVATLHRERELRPKAIKANGIVFADLNRILQRDCKRWSRFDFEQHAVGKNVCLKSLH
jgi:hypothetical protein